MTSFSNRIVFVCLSIAATTGLVSFSDPAVAVPVGGTRQVQAVSAGLALPAVADAAGN